LPERRLQPGRPERLRRSAGRHASAFRSTGKQRWDLPLEVPRAPRRR
jgi:hypothetical protein